MAVLLAALQVPSAKAPHVPVGVPKDANWILLMTPCPGQARVTLVFSALVAHCTPETFVQEQAKRPITEL
jgi:hypothetical protein